MRSTSNLVRRLRRGDFQGNPMESSMKAWPTPPLGENSRHGYFRGSSDRSLSWFPLTQNFANNAIVSSTIAGNVEIMIDVCLTRPHQCRWRQ